MSMRRALAEPTFVATRLGTGALVAISLGLLLAFRLVVLWFNGTDLFFDEAQYWTWAQEPAFGYYSKPPLIAALIGATDAVCGETTFCIRLSAPLLHTATSALIFLIGRRLYDERTGFWAALTFATLPGISLS
ncbi:MAG: glycosyltransferase family 39 protein, partial [Proteobacteria bacterium]|nr:glycosyltransferase family 39 protein [Pseudomonadota bacterium]